MGKLAGRPQEVGMVGAPRGARWPDRYRRPAGKPAGATAGIRLDIQWLYLAANGCKSYGIRAFWHSRMWPESHE
jgi:hypothetical protein